MIAYLNCRYTVAVYSLALLHVSITEWSLKANMKRHRPIITAIIALLFYTVTDILIWQRIFEANQMTHYADTYHTGWFVTLAGYALMGLVFMWGSWKECLYFLAALFIGAFSGLEDVLYYVLDGKHMPLYLPWLDRNPLIFDTTRIGVLISVSFWLASLVILYVFLFVWRKEQLPPVIEVQSNQEMPQNLSGDVVSADGFNPVSKF